MRSALRESEMTLYRICLIVFLLSQSDVACSDESLPLLPKSWQFAKVSQQPESDSDTWQEVTLPHTWNSEDASNGGGEDMQSRDGYYRGPGWYRQSLTLPNSLAGKRLFIRFEGVSSVADVYFNGHHLGQHRGAFGAFCYELTDHCNLGEENELIVRADNTWRKDVAPLSGDFPVFGGIYRPASLIAKQPVCITPLDHGSPGVYVSQPEVSRENATVEVLTKLSNSGADTEVDVHCAILDASGAVVAEETQHARVIENLKVRQELSFAEPRLWHGRRDPYLYSVEVSIKQDDKIIDRSVQPLGLRFFRVDPEEGFFLNGEPYTLYGVNRHQDRKGKGWALSESDHEEDIRLIHEIGARGLRLAHYPHAATVYDLCDEMGLMVWAELPLVDCITKSEEFSENAKQQLTELIRQHYNHPSIFCWSLFNEMYHRDSADFTQLLEELHELSKREDPFRLTVGATNKTRAPLCNKTDILAFNKYPGWYGGGPTEMSKWMEKYNELGNKRGISVSEYGAGGSIQHHQQNPPKTVPKSHWHPEEWQAIVHEGNYASITACDYCWGSFVWNMFDFASVWRDEGDARGINDKGLVTYDRKTKKDAFYFYKANWSEEPVLYITSRRHATRTEAVTPVKVYSNAELVMLTVNGKPVGTKRISDLRVARWGDIQLQEGRNTILVKAVVDGQELSDTCHWVLASEDALPPLPTGKRWERMFSDEFNGDSLDLSKWNVFHNYPRKGGFWLNKCVSLDGKGNLSIQVDRENDPKTGQLRKIAGGIDTSNRFEQRYGYFTCRCKQLLDNGKGYHCSFWLQSDGMGDVTDEGRNGTEIDVIEKFRTDDPVQHTLHWDGYGEEHQVAKRTFDWPGIREGFHIHSVLWTPDEYIFYIDGQETWRTNAGGVSQVPAFLKLTLEFSEGWNGKISEATLPDSFVVDWVRVYEAVDVR